MAIPKYYYHITQKSWPDKITLRPKKSGCNRASTEPKIYRTCVSSSIEGCLVALGCCLYWQGIDLPGIDIYRTVNKVLAVEPYDVLDSCVTKEKWLTRPIRFEKVGFINKKLPKQVYNLSTGDLDRVPSQYKLLDLLRNRKQNFVTWLK
jgi:hypothetical protein